MCLKVFSIENICDQLRSRKGMQSAQELLLRSRQSGWVLVAPCTWHKHDQQQGRQSVQCHHAGSDHWPQSIQRFHLCSCRPPVEQGSSQANADDQGGDQVQRSLCACVQLGCPDLVVLVIFVVFHVFSFCGKGWGYSLHCALESVTALRSIRFPPEILGPKPRWFIWKVLCGGALGRWHKPMRLQWLGMGNTCCAVARQTLSTRH